MLVNLILIFNLIKNLIITELKVFTNIDLWSAFIFQQLLKKTNLFVTSIPNLLRILFWKLKLLII